LYNTNITETLGTAPGSSSDCKNGYKTWTQRGAPVVKDAAEYTIRASQIV